MRSLILLFNTPSIDDWATATLNAGEMTQFQEVYTEHDGQLAYGVIVGEVVRTQIYENLQSNILGCGVDIHIGNRYDIPDSYWQYTLDQEMMTWFDRYTADTGNVIYKWL